MNALSLKHSNRKILIVTHNLNCEGAPLFLFNLAKGLKGSGHIVTVLSPCGGPLESFFKKENIELRIVDFNSDDFNFWNIDIEFDLVIVNTLVNYKFIERADFKERIIWCIHESEKDFYFKLWSDPNKDLFGQVKRVVFSSEATRGIYANLNKANNFITINTVGDWGKIGDFLKENSKNQIKKKLGFDKNDFIVNTIGTVCLRKGQMEFTASAIEILKKTPNPHLKFLMVGGGRGYEYEKEIHKLIESNSLENQIIVRNETEDVFDYYFISDIFVCSSYVEAFPMVILEAMAFGLPIISTSAYGIDEQLEDGKSGLLVMPGDKEELEKKILYLIKNKRIRKKLGLEAKRRLEEKFPYKRMIKEYNTLISKINVRTKKKTDKPTISVVIIAYNGIRDYIKETVEAVFNQVCNFSYEVIIIDSGSTDGTIDLIEKNPKIRLKKIKKSEFGHGITRRLGAEMAKGDLVVFLNQDATPADNEWLQELVRNFKDPEVVGVCGRVLPRKEASLLKKIEVNNDLAGREGKIVAQIKKKEDFKKLTFFEKRVSYYFFNDVSSCVRKKYFLEKPIITVDFAEDVEFAKMALSDGKKVVFEPKSLVFHSHKYEITKTYKRNLIDSKYHVDKLNVKNVPTIKHLLRNAVNLVKRDFKEIKKYDSSFFNKIRAMLYSPIIHLAEQLGQYHGTK